MQRSCATCDSTYSLIYFFNKHLLKAHCIPGTLLSIRKLTLNVTKPGGASDKEPTANGRDVRNKECSIPGTASSPEGGHSNPLQYSCLENLMDRGAWWATVQRFAENQTRLRRLHTHTHTHKPQRLPLGMSVSGVALGL